MTSKAKSSRSLPTPGPAARKPLAKWAGFGVVGVAVVALIVYLSIPPEKVPEGIPDGTQDLRASVTDRSHVAGPVEYDRAVPAGGPHNEIPLDCGIYDVEVPQENAVHSLEHGAVWITYRPDVGRDVVDTLAGVVRTRSKAILSPVAAQTSPIMATAWGWQLELDDPSDIRLRQFIQTFESASTAPEPNASCVGGMVPAGS